MDIEFYTNPDQTVVYILLPGKRITEICEYTTDKGTYSRINTYVATFSDIEFVRITNNRIESHDAFELIDQVFSFYQRLISECTNPHPPDAQN